MAHVIVNIHVPCFVEYFLCVFGFSQVFMMVLISYHLACYSSFPQMYLGFDFSRVILNLQFVFACSLLSLSLTQGCVVLWSSFLLMFLFACSLIILEFYSSLNVFVRDKNRVLNPFASGFFVDLNLFKANKEKVVEFSKEPDAVSGSKGDLTKDGLADEDANLMIKLKFLTYKVWDNLACIHQLLKLH